jgi:16S rRNA processing protein RimM
MGNDRILVGRFGAAHGIGGEVRLNSFTSVPEAIAAYKPLLDSSGTRQFSIIALRPLRDTMFIARLAGVADRASASALANTPLYVPRESLPRAAKDEYYLADLIGLAALTGTGERFGCVVDVLNFGGGDILEIARVGGGETLLLPFKKEIFPHVDLTAGTLTLLPPVEREPATDDQRD